MKNIKCKQCGETNPNKFYPSQLRRYAYLCKSCLKHYKPYLDSLKKWRKNNPDKLNQYNRNYYQKIKELVLNHYGDKCAVCSSTQFLAIDHIDGGGMQHMHKLGYNSSKQFYSWLIKNNYPKGYRTLCRKCNSHINSSFKSYKKINKPSRAVLNLLSDNQLYRAKDIANILETETMLPHQLLTALYNLHKHSKIMRVNKGIYTLPQDHFKSQWYPPRGKRSKINTPDEGYLELYRLIYLPY